MFLFKRETMTTSTFRLLIGVLIIEIVAFNVWMPYYRDEEGLSGGHPIEPKSSSGKQLSANNNSSYYRIQSSRLVCWRNSTVATFKRNFLVTGCGYSATGFISAAFRTAGYDVGHETPGRDGVSDWRSAEGNFRSWAPPFSFKHVFLAVQHPLKIIRSRAGTGWDFNRNFGRVRSHVTIQPAKEFDNMTMEFKTLDYWYSYMTMGENLAECYYYVRDISADLLEDICLRSELPQCEEKQWEQACASNRGFNPHTKDLMRKNPNWTISWEGLENSARTINEKSVLERARLLCSRFFDDC